MEHSCPIKTRRKQTQEHTCIPCAYLIASVLAYHVLALVILTDAYAATTASV